MKPAVVLGIAFLMLSTPASAQVIISEVHPTGSSNTTYMADWFELTNIGISAVDITGWRVDDSSNAFASALGLTGVTSILPGQSVVFVEGSAATAMSLGSAWYGVSVPPSFTIGFYSGAGIGLGSGGDQVNIFDSTGLPVTGVIFGAATAGVTFDNAAGLTGMISTLSAVGTNGGFLSNTGGEIGSPGLISPVPEPSSLVLAGVAAAGLITRRVRRRPIAKS